MLLRFLFCLFVCFLGHAYSYALSEAEQSLIPFNHVNWQKLTEKLLLLDQEIEFNFLNDSESMDLYIERGVVLLIIGKHEAAIDDFTYAINNSTKFPQPIRGKIVEEALWNRMWGYAFWGKETEFLNDMHSVSKLLSKCYQSSNKTDLGVSQSYSLPIMLCKSKRKHELDDPPFYEESNNGEETVDFCIKTVRNTINFMKVMCNAVKDLGIKTTLYLFIDGLGNEALNCCTARGFWRTCVDPMVLKIDKWKFFGIPADPYWE